MTIRDMIRRLIARHHRRKDIRLRKWLVRQMYGKSSPDPYYLKDVYRFILHRGAYADTTPESAAESPRGSR